MVDLSFLGLSWCPNLGWTVIFEEPKRARQLRIGLPLQDALVLGEEVTGRPTDRSGLYRMVGGLLDHDGLHASVLLDLTGPERAEASLLLDEAGQQKVFPVGAGDAAVIAVRAALPIHATDRLMDAFGMPLTTLQVTLAPETKDACCENDVPQVFRAALE